MEIVGLVLGLGGMITALRELRCGSVVYRGVEAGVWGGSEVVGRMITKLRELRNEPTIKAEECKFFIVKVNPDREFIVAQICGPKEGFAQVDFCQDFQAAPPLTAMFRNVYIEDSTKQIFEPKPHLGGYLVRREIPNLNPKSNLMKIRCTIICVRCPRV